MQRSGANTRIVQTTPGHPWSQGRFLLCLLYLKYLKGNLVLLFQIVCCKNILNNIIVKPTPSHPQVIPQSEGMFIWCLLILQMFQFFIIWLQNNTLTKIKTAHKALIWSCGFSQTLSPSLADWYNLPIKRCPTKRALNEMEQSIETAPFYT